MVVLKWLWQALWFFVWELSEGSGFSLGGCAPWVLEQRSGFKKVKTDA